MANHEQTHLANLVQDTPEDRRAERLSDLGVANVHDAYAQVLDLNPERPVARSAQSQAAANKPQPHYSRRGGRSYNEGSDSEHDPNWLVSQPAALSPEEVLTNHVAANMIREMLRARREAGITDLTELHRERAIQRAHDERRAQ